MKTTKQIKKAALAAALVLLASVSFAESSIKSSDEKQPEQQPDAYNDGSDLSKKQQDYLKDRENPKSKTGKDGKLELGNSSVFEYNILNTDVVQSDAVYMYMTKYDEAALRIISTTLNQYVQFGQASRSVCRTAVQSYLDDFSAKNLKRGYSDSYKVYGEVKGRLLWGLIGAGNETHPKISLGYKFVKNSPYFTLTLWPAEAVVQNDAQKDDAAPSEKSTILMNKKQAADFAKYLDEALINQAVSESGFTKESGDSY